MAPIIGTAPFVQIAYHAPDVEAAAAEFAATTGAGPFFVNRNIPLESCVYRGEEMEFDHTSAFGQCGNVMVEFLQQNNDGPSAVRDMYRREQRGLHHVAAFVTNVKETCAAVSKQGAEIAMFAVVEGGVEFAFIDLRSTLGHMLEIYVGDEGMLGFYDTIKRVAQNWDGMDPVRPMSKLAESVG
jgi:hypothetical protein